MNTSSRKEVISVYGITWRNKRGYGRWFKRRLSKARRAAAKGTLRGIHPRRSLTRIESEVNWRGT
jgi:hypothetical protein